MVIGSEKENLIFKIFFLRRSVEMDEKIER